MYLISYIEWIRDYLKSRITAMYGNVDYWHHEKTDTPMRSLTTSGIKSNNYYLSLNPKRSLEDLEKISGQSWVVFFTFFLLAANEKPCQDIMKLQA